MLADTYEQMGYQAESGPWRSVYLQGAYELRNGVPAAGGINTASPDTIKAMPPEMTFDYFAVRLNGEKAAGKKIVLNVDFTDLKKPYSLVDRKRRAQLRCQIGGECGCQGHVDQGHAGPHPTRGNQIPSRPYGWRHEGRRSPRSVCGIRRAARQVPVLVQHRHAVACRERNLVMRSSFYGITAAALLLLASGVATPPSFACGFDGILGDGFSAEHPKSIAVAFAIGDAVASGIVDKAAVAPIVPGSQGYWRAVGRINAFHRLLAAASVGRSQSPSISLLFIDSKLWARLVRGRRAMSFRCIHPELRPVMSSSSRAKRYSLPCSTAPCWLKKPSISGSLLSMASRMRQRRCAISSLLPRIERAFAASLAVPQR